MFWFAGGVRGAETSDAAKQEFQLKQRKLSKAGKLREGYSDVKTLPVKRSRVHTVPENCIFISLLLHRISFMYRIVIKSLFYVLFANKMILKCKNLRDSRRKKLKSGRDRRQMCCVFCEWTCKSPQFIVNVYIRALRSLNWSVSRHHQFSSAEYRQGPPRQQATASISTHWLGLAGTGPE